MQKNSITKKYQNLVNQINNFEDGKDYLIGDLNNNGSLIVDLHDRDQDSRIVDIHSHNDFLMVDFHNQDKASRIIAVHNKDALCMYMFIYAALI